MDKLDRITQSLVDIMEKVKELKQENANLSAQLEKERKDKEVMASILKKRLVEINEMPNYVAEFCQEEKQELEQALASCGVTK